MLVVNFTVSSDTPAFNLIINITFPNSVTILQSTSNGTETTTISSTSIGDSNLIQLNVSYFNSSLQLEIDIKINNNISVGTLLQPLSSMEYSSLPEDGELYSEEVDIPPIFIGDISSNVSLIFTSEPETFNATIIYHEFAVIEVVTSIVGPVIDFTVEIITNENDLNIVNGQASYFG